MSKEITEKLAYTIYEDRIAEEKRTDISLGDADSDWRRAERVIEFCEKEKREGDWMWCAFRSDNFKYIVVYERLKCQASN
jgi:hypothetical protein